MRNDASSPRDVPDRLRLAGRCQQAVNVAGGDCFPWLSGELNDGFAIFSPPPPRPLPPPHRARVRGTML